MIGCIAALLLHFGTSASVTPKLVLDPTIEVAALPDAPTVKPEVRPAEAQVVSSASQGSTQSSISDGDTRAPQTLATNDTPEPQPATPIHIIPVYNPPVPLPWLILSAVQHSAATFDAYSTRRAIAHGAIETDPMMRPFAHSPAIYGAIQVAPAMLDILARYMQGSRNTLWRHTWWVPQSASTGLYIFSGIHNLRVDVKR
jgi:hypothetical protein